MDGNHRLLNFVLCLAQKKFGLLDFATYLGNGSAGGLCLSSLHRYHGCGFSLSSMNVENDSYDFPYSRCYYNGGRYLSRNYCGNGQSLFTHCCYKPG